MPWTILEKLWRQALEPSSVSAKNETNTWNKEIETLYQLGISMEDTLQFLYFEKPNFETFKNWVNKRKKDIITDYNEVIDNVLSEDDLEFWDENGYIIVKNVISKQDCEDTQQAILDFLKIDPNDMESWYIRHPEQKGLMLNFSDHETLNKNRFSPRIKKAYEQLYNTSNIYKSIDKVSFSPPDTKDFVFTGSPLHWDTSLKRPIPFGLQGLLYLTDCGPHEGAFHCVPGFHNKIDYWLDNLEPDENPREKAIKSLEPVPIIGNAGDFIIWNNTLPHCATPNQGATPRMVQYLTYFPDNFKSAEEWI
ncbi:phytanoyl-CoA dioxygenase family protein [Flavobacterium sp. LS1R49]|uniref:Phytanoyl-CoA dioxygenase family protein n=1 Tax=Flavobacterium shii TaxID=2987687 RepID=A0A9X2ZC04_9FLAO|nr:phytanoyl-CoA dioxygenase family protein [Flavobacterium shii]MCV9928546.1 phytanoyl-CoA dioxygenase family protein [Flavobacterium shii]